MKRTKKIDLHCHLDGSLPIDTVRRLALRSGIHVPAQDEELSHLLQVPEQCNSLREYLQCFDLPIACLQTEENLYEAARDVILEAPKDDIAYMELRFAPRLHMRQGLSLERILKSVTAGIRKGQEMTGIYAGIIVCGMRDHPVRDNIEMLETAVSFRDRGVCGLDIAGNEAEYPPEVQKELFEEAVRQHIPFTIHAGECGSFENVLRAIRMGAKRIGHGIALKNSREALEECVQRKVALELCPVSNYQTKAVRDFEEYPFRMFLEAGIPVTVNTDNRTVSNTTIAEEFELLRRICGLSEPEEKQIYINSVQYSFAEQSVKEELIKML